MARQEAKLIRPQEDLLDKILISKDIWEKIDKYVSDVKLTPGNDIKYRMTNLFLKKQRVIDHHVFHHCKSEVYQEKKENHPKNLR